MSDQPRFQLTVHKTRKVKARGKSGFNDLYAVVLFGSEKHKTAVHEKCKDDTSWEQNCYLNHKGDHNGSLFVKVCHRNFLLTSDETIGQVEILLKHFTFYESPKTSWFMLESKTSKNEGEIKLTLTYHAVLPTTLDHASMKTSSKTFSNKMFSGRRSTVQMRKKRSLCDLTKNDSERNKDLSVPQIMPGDVRCLYWEAGEESKQSDAMPQKKGMFKHSGARRHSLILCNNKDSFEYSLSSKDFSILSEPNDTMNLTTDSDNSNTLPRRVKRKIRPCEDDFSNRSSEISTDFESISLSKEHSNSQINNTASCKNPGMNSSDNDSHKNAIEFESLDLKQESFDTEINENNTQKSSNDIENDKNNIYYKNINYDNTDQNNNLTSKTIYDNTLKKNTMENEKDRNLKGEHIDLIKDIGDGMVKQIEELNSRNALFSHFNQFSKQELVQLILDQREWIKARELYILDIEAYQKTLLLKVLEQSSRSSPMKKSFRNLIMEEVNMGVNQMLQKQRLDSAKHNIQTEGKSFAKKWFGSLFRAK